MSPNNYNNSRRESCSSTSSYSTARSDQDDGPSPNNQFFNLAHSNDSQFLDGPGRADNDDIVLPFLTFLLSKLGNEDQDGKCPWSSFNTQNWPFHGLDTDFLVLAARKNKHSGNNGSKKQQKKKEEKQARKEEHEKNAKAKQQHKRSYKNAKKADNGVKGIGDLDRIEETWTAGDARKKRDDGGRRKSMDKKANRNGGAEEEGDGGKPSKKGPR